MLKTHKHLIFSTHLGDLVEGIVVRPALFSDADSRGLAIGSKSGDLWKISSGDQIGKTFDACFFSGASIQNVEVNTAYACDVQFWHKRQT